MKPILNLINSTRINENSVEVCYLHVEKSIEFTIEWNNVNPSTGQIECYSLQIDCKCDNKELQIIIEDSIKVGSDDNLLYLELLQTFDANNKR